MAKLGEGHFGEMMKRGLHELQAASFAWGETNIAQPPSYGQSPFEAAVEESRQSQAPEQSQEHTVDRRHDRDHGHDR